MKQNYFDIIMWSEGEPRRTSFLKDIYSWFSDYEERNIPAVIAQRVTVNNGAVKIEYSLWKKGAELCSEENVNLKKKPLRLILNDNTTILEECHNFSNLLKEN